MDMIFQGGIVTSLKLQPREETQHVKGTHQQILMLPKTVYVTSNEKLL